MNFEKDFHYKHYQKVAKAYGLSERSTMADPYIRLAEQSFIHGEIFRYIAKTNKMPYILDVGCGNGHLLSTLKECFPEVSVCAIEPHPDMLCLCAQREIPGLELHQINMLESLALNKKFDIVITQRTVINLSSVKKQKKWCKVVSQLLKPQGLYLIIESFKTPLMNLNRARKENCLPQIQTSAHNLYLSEYFIDQLQKQGLWQLPPIMQTNYLSTHFFLTRVYHPLLLAQGRRVKQNSLTNFFDQALPVAIDNYSPIQFHTLQKR